MNTYQLHQGDCLETLRGMADNSVDSIVTDPPYGLSQHTPAEVLECLKAWLAGEVYQPKGKGFMGAAWDAWVPGPEVWRECLRVLKPGGHVLAFAGTRSMDLMSMAIRLAGFELRDAVGYAHDGGGAPLLAWTFGSGFPKSHDVSKAIDREAGAEREVIGTAAAGSAPLKRGHVNTSGGGMSVGTERCPEFDITAPATDAARQWAGWGSALKPAWEPIILARKPLVGTLAANVLAHGTGALNIDGCRVVAPEGKPLFVNGVDRDRSRTSFDTGGSNRTGEISHQGRWPANLILSDDPEVLAVFPQSNGGHTPAKRGAGGISTSGHAGQVANEAHHDTGSAARFFYTAKASQEDRDAGLHGFEPKTGTVGNKWTDQDYRRGDEAPSVSRRNHHPTVKPTDLMRYLVRLVTPPGGTVLDPFNGSGSTGKACMLEGFAYIGCELDPAYIEISRARIEHAIALRASGLQALKPASERDAHTVDLFAGAA